MARPRLSRYQTDSIDSLLDEFQRTLGDVMSQLYNEKIESGMDTLNSIHLDNHRMLRQILALVGGNCQEADEGIPTNQQGKNSAKGSSSIALAKDKKYLFILYMLAIYEKGVFVTAESKLTGKEQRVSNFKKMMIELGQYLNEDFSDVDQLLQHGLDKCDSIDEFYDLIGIISKKILEKREKREAINKVRSNKRTTEKPNLHY